MALQGAQKAANLIQQEASQQLRVARQTLEVRLVPVTCRMARQGNSLVMHQLVQRIVSASKMQVDVICTHVTLWSQSLNETICKVCYSARFGKQRKKTQEHKIGDTLVWMQHSWVPFHRA